MSNYIELKRLATEIQSCQSISPSDEAAWMRRTTGEKVLLSLEEIEDVDALRKDAERYRWLRAEAIMFHPSCEGMTSKDAYLTITGYGDDDSVEIIDSAVDEAMSKVITP